MKRKKRVSKKRRRIHSIEESLEMYSEFGKAKKQMDKFWEYIEKNEERMQDIEIHVNLLTRLLTTLCVEKFGMRIGVLKRLIKRIEKEAIRDSQILHLESLYKLPPSSDKKNQKEDSSSGKDPWDEIS